MRFLLLCLASCSSPPSIAPPAPAPPADAGMPDAHEVRLSAVARSDRVLPSPRDHHTSAVIEVGGKPFLYAFGGTNAWTTILDEIVRAPIADDGSLGAFEKAGTLPEPRAGHAMVVIDGHVIISGGNSMSSGSMHLLDSTIVAPIEADGTLVTWTTGPKLPVPIMHHTCNADGMVILCVGGRIAGNYTSKLAVRTSWSGALDPYSSIAPLAKSIGFHQAFVRDHHLYVVGGLHRDVGMTDFDRLTAIARIAFDDGAAWEDAGSLPEPRYVSAAELVGGRVYFFGGQNGNDDVVGSILSGTFDTDGHLQVSAESAKLSIARMHVHQTPAYKNWIYSAGGRDENNQSLDVIDIGTFE